MGKINLNRGVAEGAAYGGKAAPQKKGISIRIRRMRVLRPGCNSEWRPQAPGPKLVILRTRAAQSPPEDRRGSPPRRLRTKARIQRAF